MGPAGQSGHFTKRLLQRKRMPASANHHAEGIGSEPANGSVVANAILAPDFLKGSRCGGGAMPRFKPDARQIKRDAVERTVQIVC